MNKTKLCNQVGLVLTQALLFTGVTLDKLLSLFVSKFWSPLKGDNISTDGISSFNPGKVATTWCYDCACVWHTHQAVYSWRDRSLLTSASPARAGKAGVGRQSSAGKSHLSAHHWCHCLLKTTHVQCSANALHARRMHSSQQLRKTSCACHPCSQEAEASRCSVSPNEALPRYKAGRENERKRN